MINYKILIKKRKKKTFDNTATSYSFSCKIYENVYRKYINNRTGITKQKDNVPKQRIKTSHNKENVPRFG